MNDRQRDRTTGPLGQFEAGFVARLTAVGFTKQSADVHVALMRHLGRWLTTHKLQLDRLSADQVDRYLADRCKAGYTGHRTTTAMVPLLDYLREIGVVPLPVATESSTPVDLLLARFRNYLTIERRLALTTVDHYVNAVRPFVAMRSELDGLGFKALTASDITMFVTTRCPQQGRGAAKMTVKSLRSLLRFLHVDGVLARSLVNAVPSVASWQMAGLPRTLEASEVSALLSSCDQRTTSGRRDFAILTLLARLGLRADEVARLGLDDIDWLSGEIVVTGKGSKAARLPLPSDVGEAVASYLRRGRPRTALGRTVFVRVNAPHCALTRSGVSDVVLSASQRSGLDAIRAHRLRHTAATQMLRAGAALPEIGQVLRHQRARTTAIYAKVNRDALRSIARPWPGEFA